MQGLRSISDNKKEDLQYREGQLLAVSHYRGNRSKINHWILRQTYQLHQLVSQLVGGARSPIERQPVIASPPSHPTKMEEPQTAVLP